MHNSDVIPFHPSTATIPEESVSDCSVSVELCTQKLTPLTPFQMFCLMYSAVRDFKISRFGRFYKILRISEILKILEISEDFGRFQ